MKDLIDNTEQQLRAEIAELRRRLEARERAGAEPRPPSRRTLWTLALLAAALVVVGFATGYIPRQRRESLLVAEAKADSLAAPTVNIVPVTISDASSRLVLPGNIQAVTEAPVLARASGYIRRRSADIGDHVAAGQVLAEIEAPELDQQIRQAKASVQQAASALEQAGANVLQGRSNEQLAKVTAQRWSNLAAKGVVSRQENDTYQAQYAAAQANVQALEKAVAAARSNVAAAEANVARLTEMKSYQQVRAPFPGVITVRNVDTGALVNEGNTLLFRIAQTGRLRIYVNVPQSEAEAVRVGQPARVSIIDLPGREFAGTVTRSAKALDPSSRTLLTEIQLPNPDAALLPGMYAQVDLRTERSKPPLLIPGDTLVIRPDGPEVAVVDASHKVHYQRIELGRDYGDRIEVLSGLQAGQSLVVNPGDLAREGASVNPVLLREKKH